MNTLQRCSIHLPVLGAIEANPVPYLEELVLLMHIGSWTERRHSADLRPWNEHWKGSQESRVLTWLRCLLRWTQASSGLCAQEGSRVCLNCYTCHLVLTFFGCQGLFVSTPRSQLWLLGTCPPCLIVSSHLLLTCVMGRSVAPVWFHAPKMLGLGVL